MSADMSPPKPIIAAHLLISEPSLKPVAYETIPTMFKSVRFDAMDVLYVSPFAVQSDKSFGLKPMDGKVGVLQKRFEWTIAQARALNENIKIIVMNMMANDEGYQLLNSPNDIEKYASSVADFMDHWNNKTLFTESNRQVKARIDGYDIDYEEGTVIANAPVVLKSIRQKLDNLSNTKGYPPFQVSASPASWNHLGTLANVLHCVNVQNYDGGLNFPISNYISEIKDLKYSQILRGISSEKIENVNSPETRAAIKARNLELLLKADKTNDYAGIMVWRLNSHVWVYENAFQVMLYNHIHKTQLKQLQGWEFATDDEIFKEWERKSRGEQDEPKQPWAKFAYA